MRGLAVLKLDSLLHTLCNAEFLKKQIGNKLGKIINLGMYSQKKIVKTKFVIFVGPGEQPK